MNARLQMEWNGADGGAALASAKAGIMDARQPDGLALLPTPKYLADPAAHVFSDGRLWLYADQDPHWSNDGWWSMNDYHAFSTSDLETWTDHGCVLRRQDIAWADGPAWDGDCVEALGRYWYYFPMVDQIGVAVADRPQGPFRDARGAPLITRRTPGVRSAASGLLVSPVCVFSPHGAFLYFGQNEELYCAPLAASMTELAGPAREVSKPWKYHESPWVYHRCGRFHMLYGRREVEAARLEDERDILARAVADNPYGPFEYTGDVQRDRARTVQACVAGWRGRDLVLYHEDGPDPLHRRIRGELRPRRLDGAPPDSPRGCGPVRARELWLDVEGRHLGVDYHASGGPVERERDLSVEGDGAALLREPGAWVGFHRWRAERPVTRLRLRLRAGEQGGRLVLRAVSDEAMECAAEVPGDGRWHEVEVVWPKAVREIGELSCRHCGGGPVWLHSLSFAP